MKEQIIRTAEVLPNGSRLVPREYLENIIAECLDLAEYANEVVIPAARRAGLEHLTKDQILSLCRDATGLTETRDAEPRPVKYPKFLTYRGGKMTLDRREVSTWAERITAEDNPDKQ